MPTVNSLKLQLTNLPKTSGVYYFYNKSGQLLYIGKAVNLKRRVSSYWQKKNGAYPREFVPSITTIKIQKTDSVIEALILEANEIRLHQPPHNRDLKDDKTFVTIGITKETFPAVIVMRPTQKIRVPLKRQFGPYPSTDQAKTALQIIRRIFPFRTTCKFPLSPFHSSSGNERVENKPSQQSNFLSKQLQRGCFDYQIGLCPGPCAGKISAADYARTIQKVTLFLEGKKRQVATSIEREMRQAAKKHDFETATTLRNQLFALNHLRDVALLKKEQPISREGDTPWQRIEGYDISNIGADYAVASMVVVSNGQTDKNAYRKFQIKTVKGQNDLKMMEEVLTRRFRHLEWPLPNLVVIDGGAEHLKVGQRVLRRAKLTIPIIAAAKGPERKKLDLYPSVANLPLNDPDFLAGIRLARDETHRFAIRYHRWRRTNEFLAN